MAAILIAVAAVIDPAWTSLRHGRPEIAVVALDASNASLARRVADELDDGFTVIGAPFGGAAGTVVVGDRMPGRLDDVRTPVFAVLPAQATPSVQLETVSVPPRPGLHARVPVAFTLRAAGAQGLSVEILLEAGGVVVDRAVHEISGSDASLAGSLTFVPTAEGAVPLRVRAGLAGGSAAASADLLVDVREQRRTVLFWDARPSWMSTFVRRAVERDARITVSSRIMTSRGISTDAGQPPASLGEQPSIAQFDAIVLGAPEALTDRDVDGLDAYLRRRGGGVLLLLDRQAPGPWDRLVGAGAWSSSSSAAGLLIARDAGDSTGLHASEIAWPARLPAGARPVAFSRQVSTTADARPVVWQSAVGAGRLVVSGALDAWRFRDNATSAFDAFWQAIVADVAGATPPPIDVSIEQPRLAPGEFTNVRVTLLEPTLTRGDGGETASARIAATLEGAGLESRDVQLWPHGRPGELQGRVRAPDVPGHYRLTVSDDRSRADAALIVNAGVTHAAKAGRDLLAAWVRAHGGTAFEAGETRALRAALVASLQPKRRAVTWHPMRSAWWILPFSLLLALEWWLRRRRGQS